MRELRLSQDDVKFDQRIIRVTVRKNVSKHSRKKQSDNLLFAIKEMQRKLLKLHICGCPNIKQTVIQVTDKDTPNDVKGEAKLFASGIGFKEVLTLDGIDCYRTMSNHIMEIQQVLGIEAARQSIVNEVSTTMQSHSISIDVRHILLLAELMTFKGKNQHLSQVASWDSHVKESINSRIQPLCLPLLRRPWMFSSMQQYRARKIL